MAQELAGKDGRRMLEILAGIATGELTIPSFSMDGTPIDLRPPFKERREAAIALLDRGFGKPAQPLTGEDGGPVRIAFSLAGIVRPNSE